MSAISIPLRSSWFADPARLEPIKWLAVFAMFADHLALTLLPQHTWLRDIGRYAFPAFMACFGIGLANTTRPLAVAKRLLLPAIVAQAAWVVIDGSSRGWNVLFVCATAAFTLWLYRWSPSPARWLALGVPVIAVLFKVEGGPLAFAVIAFAFSAARGSPAWLLVGAVAWLGFHPSSAAAAAFVSIFALPRLADDCTLPHKRGVLAWVYAGHLAVLATLMELQ